MKNLVALLCLISALVGSAFSGKCRSCDCVVPSNCKETVINCSTNGCMTVSEWMYFNEDFEKKIWKGCEDSMRCGVKRSEDSGIYIYKSKYNCCTGDSCNTDGYAFTGLESLEKSLKRYHGMWHPGNKKK
ncbi:uncharacterized protein ACNLHF_002515 [Anomaloglossus baeobatrachus]